MPSIWYEGFPLTIVEAYSVATPVLCSKIGSLEEVVIPDKTGFHFKHNDIYELAQTMEYAINLDPLNYSLLRKSTLDNFERKYTEEINYQFLMNIYHEAIEENRYGIAIRS